MLIEHIRGAMSSMSQCVTPWCLVVANENSRFMLVTFTCVLVPPNDLAQVQPYVAL